MTAAVGATVKLYVDLVAEVTPGDIIETDTGRRYGVLTVRVQERGKHRGRQHLGCVVVPEGTEPNPNLRASGDHRPGVVHRIRWYVRGRGKR